MIPSSVIHLHGPSHDIIRRPSKLGKTTIMVKIYIANPSKQFMLTNVQMCLNPSNEI